MASDLALEGETPALMFEGDRGIRGDTALDESAIFNTNDDQWDSEV